MIYIYHLLTSLLLPIYFLLLVWRLFKKKENISRILERFGRASRKRPAGTLIWLHAASVGESAIALTLIENLTSLVPRANFLVTSGTLASAEILQAKLPQNAIHQFLPIDNLFFIKKFLENWQPNLGIFIEAEIWPGLLSEASKVCKLLLINAHISDKSFERWNKLKPFFQKIMANFSEIMTQSIFDFEKYHALGVNNLANIGNIKFANKKLMVDTAELKQLLSYLENKKIIVLASTHLSDEQVVLKIIKPIKEHNSDCYFILILRHPNRRSEIAKQCKELNLSYAFKSQISLPNLQDDIYIVDKFGELGLFYSLAYISFVGGSFGKGGHNPIEPAHFGNLILFGPDMENCREIAESMLEKRAAIQFHNSNDLLHLVQHFLTEKGINDAETFKNNALMFTTQYQQILQNYLSVIMKYI